MVDFNSSVPVIVHLKVPRPHRGRLLGRTYCTHNNCYSIHVTLPYELQESGMMLMLEQVIFIKFIYQVEVGA